MNITKAYKVLSDEDTRRRYHRDNKMISETGADQQESEREARRRARTKAKAKAKTGATSDHADANERQKSVQHEIASPKARRPTRSGDEATPRAGKGRSSRARRYFEQGQKDYKLETSRRPWRRCTSPCSLTMPILNTALWYALGGQFVSLRPVHPGRGV